MNYVLWNRWSVGWELSSKNETVTKRQIFGSSEAVLFDAMYWSITWKILKNHNTFQSKNFICYSKYEKPVCYVQANSKQNLRCSKCLVTFQMTCAHMTSDITHIVTKRSSWLGGISTDIDCLAVPFYLLMEYLVNMKMCSICCHWYRLFI